MRPSRAEAGVIMSSSPSPPTLAAGARADQADAPESVSGLTKEGAEALLDWLEAHGCRDAQVCLDESGGFTVRYRTPGPRAGRCQPS